MSDIENSVTSGSGPGARSLSRSSDWHFPASRGAYPPGCGVVSPAALTLGECGITIGRSDLSANGQLTGYIGYVLRGDRLAGRLYLRSGQLDLNELLSLAPDTTAEEPAAEEPAALPET